MGRDGKEGTKRRTWERNARGASVESNDDVYTREGTFVHVYPAIIFTGIFSQKVHDE